MEVKNEDGNERNSLFSDPPRVLQVTAVAVLVLGVGAALAYYAQYVFPSGERSDGWGIASATFYFINSAVFAPAVLLSLVALLLVRSDEKRDRAIKMTRLIMVAVVLLVLLGLAEVVCLVGQVLSDESSVMSGWYVAGQAFSFMTSVLYESGVLLGLVYIFRQQERKYAAKQLSGDLPGAEQRRPDGS
jgi:cytochrome c biogenesis factor